VGQLLTHLGEVSRFLKAERLYAKKTAGYNHLFEEKRVFMKKFGLEINFIKRRRHDSFHSPSG